MKYIATSNLCQEIMLPTGRNKYEEKVWQLEMQIHSAERDLSMSKSVLRWMDYDAKVIRTEREIKEFNKQIVDIKYNKPEYFL